MKLQVAVILIVALPSMSSANEAAIQACTDIYKNSTRNISDVEYNNLEMARSYSSFCKTDGSVNTSASGIGLDAVVKSIPFKFSAESKNNTERLTEFCKIGRSQFDTWSQSRIALSVVANDALTNFNNCIRIANSGLNLTFSINQPDTLVVSGFASAGYSGAITSVAYDEQGMTCNSANFNAEKKSEEIRGAVNIKISEPFAITCMKKPQIAGDGQTKFYPRTTLTLTASAVNPLAIVFPSDILNGFDLASQAGLAVAQAATEVSTAKAETAEQRLRADAFERRLSGVTAQVTTHEFGDGTAWGCPQGSSDWGFHLHAEAKRVCGENPYVVGSNNVRSGNTCGYGSNGFACVIIPK